MPEVAEFIDSSSNETGEWFIGKYWLIAHHNNEMLACSAKNVPVGALLDIAFNSGNLSGKVIATFNLKYLTINKLKAFLEV